MGYRGPQAQHRPSSQNSWVQPSPYLSYSSAENGSNWRAQATQCAVPQWASLESPAFCLRKSLKNYTHTYKFQGCVCAYVCVYVSLWFFFFFFLVLPFPGLDLNKGAMGSGLGLATLWLAFDKC